VLHKKTIIVSITMLILVAGSLLVVANSQIDQTATIAGTVTSVVALNTTVGEGDTLVTVGTMTGPVAAARATQSGVVKAVLVAPGTSIKVNDVVARIQVGK